MAEMAAGAELDAAVGKFMGLNVLGITYCECDPECGAWGLPWTQGHDWQASGQRPVYLEGCVCDVAGMEDGETPIFGHSASCLAAVPEYSTDWGAMGALVAHLRAAGWYVNLLSIEDIDGAWRAEIIKHPRLVRYMAATPMHALALTALKAFGGSHAD